jgi:hypothetical protein
LFKDISFSIFNTSIYGYHITANHYSLGTLLFYSSHIISYDIQNTDIRQGEDMGATVDGVGATVGGGGQQLEAWEQLLKAWEQKLEA